jgi:hypothetical protein
METRVLSAILCGRLRVLCVESRPGAEGGRGSFWAYPNLRGDVAPAKAYSTRHRRRVRIPAIGGTDSEGSKRKKPMWIKCPSHISADPAMSLDLKR